MYKIDIQQMYRNLDFAISTIWKQIELSKVDVGISFILPWRTYLFGHPLPHDKVTGLVCIPECVVALMVHQGKCMSLDGTSKERGT